MRRSSRAAPARWVTVGFLLCAALAVFFSWPEFPLPADIRRVSGICWEVVVQRKVAHPGYDCTTEFKAETNEAKRNFRLTVPLAAFLKHTGIPGVLAFRFFLQAVFLMCLLLSAERIAILAAAVSLLVPNVFIMGVVCYESSVPVRLLLDWLPGIPA